MAVLNYVLAWILILASLQLRLSVGLYRPTASSYRSGAAGARQQPETSG